jgi:hypothetical protein
VRRVALAVAVLLQSCTCNPPPPKPPMCPSSCLGCCNESGRCESGLLADACGFLGSACVACPEGAPCLGGTCAIPTDGGRYPCGILFCGGTRDNLCVKGQCTCGGLAACPAGTICVGKECICNETTCQGCCSGSICVGPADLSASFCGAGGGACTDCLDAGANGCSSQGLCTCADQTACDPGRACVGGECECDPVACADGCCHNRQCIHGGAQTAMACGTGGHVCAVCNPGLADGCTEGVCSCGGAAACANGQVCRGGTCVCDAASCGTGCCRGTQCIAPEQQTNAQCGPPGGVCIECGDALCLPSGCNCQGHLACGAAGIAAGDDFTCAAAVSGALRCWGAALDGGTDVPLPDILPLPHSATAVSAGSGFGCALTSGGVECFGATALGFAPRVEQLSAGASHVCGINAGQVFCWGDDGSGQLGVAGSDGGFFAAPGRVAAIDGGATSVAAGAAHTCAIVNGQVQCWGQIAPPPTFDAGVVALASGDGVSCAAVPSQVVCWGSASPAAGTFAIDAVMLSVGSDFACAVLTDDSVRCWGVNDHGQLGSPDGGALTTMGRVTAISTGRAHACAIGTNLQVWCWGEGTHSKLGVGMSGDQPVPAPVSD